MEKLDGKLIIALARSLQTAHKKSEALFRAHGLTMAQFAALEVLYHKGDMNVGSLIRAVLSSGGNMTVVVRNLEKRGWVDRCENPGDRRSFVICLTPTGRELIEALFKRHMALVHESLGALTETEKETVIAILRKLK